MVSRKIYTTSQNISELRSIFSDLQNFAQYHPLIISISKEDENGYYKVKEKPFSLFPFAISYWVKPLLSNNEVTYLVKGLPFLKPKLHYVFQETNELTELIFTIEIKGFLGANQYLGYKMTKAMNQLMLNINSIN